MIFVDCYRKNVFIKDNLVGYIDGEGFIYISGKKFAELTEDGDIYVNDELVGYIEDGEDSTGYWTRAISNFTDRPCAYALRQKAGHIGDYNARQNAFGVAPAFCI